VGRNFLSLNWRPSCQIRSKACATSRKIQEQQSFFSRDVEITSTTRCNWWIVLCELRKPNWVFGSMLLVVICGVIRLRISLSNTFERKGNRLIGLNDVGVSSGLSGLENRTILENFPSNGKYESLRIALKIYVISIMAFFGRHLTTSAVIRSKPGDFLVSIFGWSV